MGWNGASVETCDNFKSSSPRVARNTVASCGCCIIAMAQPPQTSQNSGPPETDARRVNFGVKGVGRVVWQFMNPSNYSNRWKAMHAKIKSHSKSRHYSTAVPGGPTCQTTWPRCWRRLGSAASFMCSTTCPTSACSPLISGLAHSIRTRTTSATIPIVGSY